MASNDNRNAVIIGYFVKNRVTGVSKRYQTSRAASASQNRQDIAYGAVCTSRHAVWSDDEVTA